MLFIMGGWYYFSESNGTLTTFLRIITIIAITGTEKKKNKKNNFRNSWGNCLSFNIVRHKDYFKQLGFE